jgi:hypothetical protein
MPCNPSFPFSDERGFDPAPLLGRDVPGFSVGSGGSFSKESRRPGTKIAQEPGQEVFLMIRLEAGGYLNLVNGARDSQDNDIIRGSSRNNLASESLQKSMVILSPQNYPRYGGKNS